MKSPLQVRDTQRIALNILKTIAHICEEQDLRYFLFYGSLIGAVRHQGYIPWDDDTDIMMPRPDYDKLLTYLKRSSSRQFPYSVFNHEVSTDYPYMITRISDDSYAIDMDNEKPYGLGVFIDIYPFDGLGDTMTSALKFGMQGDRLSSLCYQATRKHYAVETTTSVLRKILKFPVFLFAKMIGKDYFQNKLTNLANRIPYDESKYVGCVVWLSGGEKDIFPREWFDTFETLSFEDSEFRVPGKYKEFLTKVYGDYMALPPEKDRIGHHNYAVYKK